MICIIILKEMVLLQYAVAWWPCLLECVLRLAGRSPAA